MMKSKLRVLVTGLGLLILVGLGIYWWLTTWMIAGMGAPLVEGGLRGVRGRLAFVSQLPATRGIHLVNADGSDRNILSVASDTLTWSPDGTRLAIESCCIDFRSSITIINADGSGRIELTQNGGAAAWSPDGTRLVFVTNEADQRASISSVNADGSGLRQLTSDGNAPAWSPNGTRLAFATYRGRQALSISVINADGSGLSQLTNGIAGAPIWSPDGLRIAFVSSSAGYAGIYVINADGSNLIHLTDNPHVNANLAWSPDSTRLMFETMLWSGGRPSIYVASTDGSQLAHLTSSWGSDMSPSWSPDGTRIAFRRNPWTIEGDLLDEQQPHGAGIFIIGADGSGLTRLTPISVEVNEGPFWSPDGRTLAFTAAEGQNRYDMYLRPNVPMGVFVVAADGSAMARLAEEGVAPVWMPGQKGTR
jgi:Tol biopolymer transport system component